MKNVSLSQILETIVYLSAFVFSILIMVLVISEKNYLLFKENSIQYLKDATFSIELTDNWVSLSSLPKNTDQVLIQVEDKRFLNHKGYSPYDIHSVILQNIFYDKKLRGASTITQQLARTLFLNRDKTLQRKIKEIQIAVALERIMDKREILEYYINTVYWGHGFNGIYYASRYHLGKPPEELNIEELSQLIHILKAPDYKK